MRKPIAAALLLIAVSACSSGAPRRAVPPASSGSTLSTAVTTPPTVPATTGPATTGPAGATTTPGTRPVAGPCRGAAPPAAYTHVVVIVMENRGLDQVNGTGSAPYVTGLGRQCGLATGYSGVAHPSLPNYIAMTSGSTHGISDDSGPSSHPLAGPSIFSLLGTGWRSLQESMPAPCDHSSGGRYATKHNPAVYYTDIAKACAIQDVPMNDQAPDLSARYTFITPNLCNDGHDCSTSVADHWLSVEVPLILGSAEYRSGGTVLFITWDENDAGGSLVPTYVVAPSVPPGTTVSTPFTHYSLLRTTEELLGLTPLLGAAATAASMRDAFHL
ncbi:MAG TPA: alkaline phosphatase family protein [Acidimicrobiales bacterium]|nr:alkaline phosphatase family protein [Acidimicrobiales bacterium]